MFSGSRRYRIGYIVLAFALLGVGIAYMWNADSVQASEPSLTLDCASCHAEAPVVMARPAADPCDACHDEAPAPERVISVERDLIALEHHAAALWDNPLQKLSSRYGTAMDQLWQAKLLAKGADSQSDVIVVEDLIKQVEASLNQLENEARWGHWRALDGPDLPTEAITSNAPSPIPIVAHTLGDSLSYLTPMSEFGQNPQLAGLLVLSLCLLMVGLRRAPPDDACNFVDDLNRNFLTERGYFVALSVFVCIFLHELAQHLYRPMRLEEATRQENRFQTLYIVLIQKGNK